VKAVVPYAVFLVALILILLFFLLAIFSGWIKFTGFEATKYTCTIKLTNYCKDWWTKNFQSEPTPSWEARGPINCEQPDIGIKKPSVEDCKKILGIP
jgi:hypothetical protein